MLAIVVRFAILPTSHMSGSVHGGCPMQRERRVKLFRNGSDQIVRIPAEFEIPGDEALIYRRGDRLVIEPVRKQSLLAVLAGLTPLDEDFPDIDEEQPPLRDAAL